MAAKKKGARHMREWSDGDMKKLRQFAKLKVSARVAAQKLGRSPGAVGVGPAFQKHRCCDYARGMLCSGQPEVSILRVPVTLQALPSQASSTRKSPLGKVGSPISHPPPWVLSS